MVPTLNTITAVTGVGDTVATTKYTVGTSVNTRGQRYARIKVKCDTVFTLYGWGHTASFASAAGNAPTTGCAITSETKSACAATTADGNIFYMRCAGNQYFLPLLYQASGGNATVTMTVSFFD